MVRALVFSAVLLVVVAGLLVFSKVHAAQVAHDERIAALQTRLSDANALTATYQRNAHDMDGVWDKFDEARRDAIQMGDQRYDVGIDARANGNRVASILRREKATIAEMDRLATQVGNDEAAALKAFGARYASSAPATSARQDLGLALAQIHIETKRWDRALGALLRTKNAAAGAYYVNDTSSSSIKADFDAEQQAGENANAARDALQADWDMLTASVKSDADDAAKQLATSP